MDDIEIQEAMTTGDEFLDAIIEDHIELFGI